MLKRLHLWLHNNYQGIRFWVAMATAAIVIITMSITTQAELQDNRQVTRERAAQIEQIVTELKNDNQRQTQLIACLLAIHGETSSITSQDAERCRTEAQVQLDNSDNQSSIFNTTLNAVTPPAPEDEAGGGSTPPNQPPSPPEPVRILGLPVCVPLTDVCAREDVLQ